MVNVIRLYPDSFSGVGPGYRISWGSDPGQLHPDPPPELQGRRNMMYWGTSINPLQVVPRFWSRRPVIMSVVEFGSVFFVGPCFWNDVGSGLQNLVGSWSGLSIKVPLKLNIFLQYSFTKVIIQYYYSKFIEFFVEEISKRCILKLGRIRIVFYCWILFISRRADPVFSRRSDTFLGFFP